MNTPKTESQHQFPKVGDEALAAVQQAVREALIERHDAGQKVPTWRDGKVVWIAVTENGEYAE